MVEFDDINVDFVRRTLLIIDQYEQYIPQNIPRKEQFEITLLINCLLGLLILPKARHSERIPSESIESWGMNKEFIRNWGNERNKNLKGLIHQLRNSVAHFDITANSFAGEISEIVFRDTHFNNNFEAVIPVKKLSEFVRYFGRFLIE